MFFHGSFFIAAVVLLATMRAAVEPSLPSPLTFHQNPGGGGSDYVALRGAYSIGLDPQGFALALSAGRAGESPEERLRGLADGSPPGDIGAPARTAVSMTLLGSAEQARARSNPWRRPKAGRSK